MIVSMSFIFGTDADDVIATVDAIDKAWVEEKPNDVFENVNKRELELGCAAMASFLYLIDQKL